MSKTASIRPFPWSSLDHTTKEDARALRALRQWCAATARLDRLASAMEALLDARVEVLAPGGAPPALATALEGGFACLLAPEGARHSGVAVLLEVEAPLAAEVVARALKRTAPPILDASRRPSARVAGALAAVVTAAMRKAHAAIPLRVVAAGPAPEIARDYAARPEAHVAVPLTVLLDDTAYFARATIPRGMVPAAGLAPCDRSMLEALGDVRLAIPLVAASTEATAADIGSLAAGDAWLPGAWTITRTPAGVLTGTVALAAALGEQGVRAELGADGRLVLRGGVVSLPWSTLSQDSEVTMNDDKPDALTESVGEVPVVVRVEIGMAEMRAREWAELGAGDVIALGKRVGDRAVLRVGGVEVGRGELVDIDGEIGVRILERVGG